MLWMAAAAEVEDAENEEDDLDYEDTEQQQQQKLFHPQHQHRVSCEVFYKRTLKLVKYEPLLCNWVTLKQLRLEIGLNVTQLKLFSLTLKGFFSNIVFVHLDLFV